MIKRIRQFLKNISYSYQTVDQDFISSYLDPHETALFNKLQKSEQIHAVLVAKGVLEELDADRHQSFIKAVLLHDIGKIVRPLSIVEKSLAVMMDKLFQEKAVLEKVAFMKSYRNHGPRGKEILLKMDVFKDEPIFYEVVGTHQETDEMIIGRKNETLRFYHNLLKKYDERY